LLFFVKAYCLKGDFIDKNVLNVAAVFVRTLLFFKGSLQAFFFVFRSLFAGFWHLFPAVASEEVAFSRQKSILSNVNRWWQTVGCCYIYRKKTS